jgi:hypothetical protein
MSKFCTSCGTPSDGSAFCTDCGATTGIKTVATSNVLAPVDEAKAFSKLPPASLATESAQNPKTTGKNKKKVFVLLGLILILTGTGTGAFFAGQSSIDLENQKKISYDNGVNDGKRTGDSEGYRRGLELGKESGCRKVFSFSDGTFDYLIPYDPNSYYNKYPGGYYVSRSNC